MNPTHVYLAIWPIDDAAGDGRPEINPALGWRIRLIPTAPVPAWDIRRPEAPDEPFVVASANAINGSALYALAGEEAFLEALAAQHTDAIAPGAEVWRLAIEGTARARLACRAWRWWRCDVTEMVDDVATQLDGVVRRLSAEGVMLPDPAVTPLPWDLDKAGTIVPTAQAVRRVRALHNPALLWTVAGLGLHVLTESTPDRSEP